MYTLQELSTLLAKIEASLSSRPLSPMSGDPASVDTISHSCRRTSCVHSGTRNKGRIETREKTFVTAALVDPSSPTSSIIIIHPWPPRFVCRQPTWKMGASARRKFGRRSTRRSTWRWSSRSSQTDAFGLLSVRSVRAWSRSFGSNRSQMSGSIGQQPSPWSLARTST